MDLSIIIPGRTKYFNDFSKWILISIFPVNDSDYDFKLDYYMITWEVYDLLTNAPLSDLAVTEVDSTAAEMGDDVITPMEEFVRGMIEESAAKYAQEKGITPRDCK